MSHCSAATHPVKLAKPQTERPGIVQDCECVFALGSRRQTAQLGSAAHTDTQRRNPLSGSAGGRDSAAATWLEDFAAWGTGQRRL
ncbi:hypothetical protein MHYP_G00157020 [Metynnis hypsauchen]